MLRRCRCRPLTAADDARDCALPPLSGGAGDKILLPPSALNALTQRNVQWPMMFRLAPARAGAQACHAGVLEFTAVEGRAHLPIATMRSLGLAEGAFIDVRNVQLPKARFVKFQPVSKEFITLRDPKAVLERQLCVAAAACARRRCDAPRPPRAATAPAALFPPAGASFPP